MHSQKLGAEMPIDKKKMHGILNEPTQGESYTIEVKSELYYKLVMHDKLYHQLFHYVYSWNTTIIQVFNTPKQETTTP